MNDGFAEQRAARDATEASSMASRFGSTATGAGIEPRPAIAQAVLADSSTFPVPRNGLIRGTGGTLALAGAACDARPFGIISPPAAPLERLRPEVRALALTDAWGPRMDSRPARRRSVGARRGEDRSRDGRAGGATRPVRGSTARGHSKAQQPTDHRHAPPRRML